MCRELTLHVSAMLAAPLFMPQCNTRSGTPPSPYIDSLLRCGLDMRDTPTEKEGEFTTPATAAPAAHAASS